MMSEPINFVNEKLYILYYYACVLKFCRLQRTGVPNNFKKTIYIFLFIIWLSTQYYIWEKTQKPIRCISCLFRDKPNTSVKLTILCPKNSGSVSPFGNLFANNFDQHGQMSQMTYHSFILEINNIINWGSQLHYAPVPSTVFPAAAPMVKSSDNSIETY